MKNIYTILFLTAVIATANAQENFNSNLATAKSSYSSGKLEDARFAMQQMLTEIDIAIGKELLKMLPTKMDAFNANTKSDNVTANTGLAGAIVHRDYGTEEKKLNLDIMSNSPLVATLNAFLSMPFVGNSGDGTQKTVKVQGYKGMLTKSTDTETNKTDYTLQIPLNSTLLTFTVPDSNEADVLKFAGTIPVSDIAKLVQ
jgi:hypothetical protein